MSYETLTYEMRGPVLILTLNREPRRNAVNRKMSEELPAAWARFDADAAARVAIVTGAGERAFCSGADLADPPAMDAPGNKATIDSIRWTAMQNGVSKPVIAAVNGGAVGGGLHFVADADIVIASQNAYFSDPHVAVGYTAALEPIMLARRMPLGAVMRMALTGGLERLDAQAALRLGLADEVTSPDMLLAEAVAIAEKIAQHSPSAVARTKRAIWGAKDLNLPDALAAGWTLIMDQVTHPDAAEGPRAFIERRKPKWLPPGGGAKPDE